MGAILPQKGSLATQETGGKRETAEHKHDGEQIHSYFVLTVQDLVERPNIGSKTRSSTLALFSSTSSDAGVAQLVATNSWVSTDNLEKTEVKAFATREQLL